MMCEFIELSLSIKEKIIFLFTGHINKKYLITNNVTTIKQKSFTKPVMDIKPMMPENEKVRECVPFFDFVEHNDIKSNL